MSKTFSIASRNGRMRAESEDGENITLMLWDTAGYSAKTANHVVTVKLADLRQIVSHFDWLQEGRDSDRKEQTEHSGITVEIDPDRIARLVAKAIAKQIRLSPGNR